MGRACGRIRELMVVSGMCLCVVDMAWAQQGTEAIGTITAILATEPERSAQAEAAHSHQKPFARVVEAAVGAFKDFMSYELAVVMLAFVVLFKFTDALAGAMTAPFVIDLGFTRNEYAAVIKGVGLAATLIGGFAGGFVARAYSLTTSLWIGGFLQAVANLTFSYQAVVGYDITMLTIAIVTENSINCLLPSISGMAGSMPETTTGVSINPSCSPIGHVLQG